MAKMVHAHWYLRFRRFRDEALDLRRSSNMRRSLYVAASWGGWKDPLGIIVGGDDLGGMAFEITARASGRAGPKAWISVWSSSWSSSWAWRGRVGSLLPSVTTCGGDPGPSYDLAAPESSCVGSPHTNCNHCWTPCRIQTRKSKRRRPTSLPSSQPSGTILRIR